jgi:uncharacterized protein (TIGR02646 family)
MLFQYPKFKHNRKLSPRRFKRYQSYKRFLQSEFVRVCVYCRQPDSSAPNIVFGVDHYRPKGIPRFAHLRCDYNNLFYCCSNCNSRKNNDWPDNEVTGPYVVNPCDHEMASHLRFDGNTGRVEPKTTHGKHTEELLQLNDEALVQYRLGTLTTVRLYSNEIQLQEQLLDALAKKRRSLEMTRIDFDAEEQSIKQEIATLRSTLQSFTGELPLPPLRKKRLGVSLL